MWSSKRQNCHIKIHHPPHPTAETRNERSRWRWAMGDGGEKSETKIRSRRRPEIVPYLSFQSLHAIRPCAHACVRVRAFADDVDNNSTPSTLRVGGQEDYTRSKGTIQDPTRTFAYKNQSAFQWKPIIGMWDLLHKIDHDGGLEPETPSKIS